MTRLQVEIAGEAVVLSHHRALYWPRAGTLVIADPHFGKAAAFRQAGVFVPEATTAAALSRLDELLADFPARRIVFIGDFLHAPEGRHPETLRSVGQWRDANPAIDMVLVRGNHDRRAGDPPREFRITCVEAPLLDPPFALAHHPREVAGHYVLAGHIHPAAVLVGPARQRARLPCFWLGQTVGVLPAFGEFTGTAVIEPAATDRVYVIAENSVIPATG